MGLKYLTRQPGSVSDALMIIKFKTEEMSSIERLVFTCLVEPPSKPEVKGDEMTFLQIKLKQKELKEKKND